MTSSPLGPLLPPNTILLNDTLFVSLLVDGTLGVTEAGGAEGLKVVKDREDLTALFKMLEKSVLLKVDAPKAPPSDQPESHPGPTLHLVH